MKPEFDTDKSIYLQIAESIEDDILRKNIEEESQVMSTNQLAVTYRINPATAAKGLNILVSNGVLYKKRGIGMFVATGAAEKIRKKRQNEFYDHFILPLMEEAGSLNIKLEEIIEMIQRTEKE